MPVSAHPVNKLFLIEIILKIIARQRYPPKAQIAAIKKLTKNVNDLLCFSRTQAFRCGATVSLLNTAERPGKAGFSHNLL